MIKIAVCDDNPYELEEVAEKIKIYLDQQETALQTVVQTFQCGEYLIMEIESGHPADIFILDVDMPGMNGFELTEEIRKRIPAPIIIFLTSHIEYGSKACKNRAFRYIYKSYSSDNAIEPVSDRKMAPGTKSSECHLSCYSAFVD